MTLKQIAKKAKRAGACSYGLDMFVNAIKSGDEKSAWQIVVFYRIWIKQYIPDLNFDEIPINTDGKLRIFHDNGNLRLLINIKNNYLNGVETLYNHNGTRYRVTTYKNGIRHGRTQYFNFDGTIRDSYKYKNGKLFDKSYYYDPEDELRIIYHYKNGQRIKAVEYRKGLIDVIHFYKNNYLAYTNTIHYFEE